MLSKPGKKRRKVLTALLDNPDCTFSKTFQNFQSFAFQLVPRVVRLGEKTCELATDMMCICARHPVDNQNSQQKKLGKYVFPARGGEGFASSLPSKPSVRTHHSRRGGGERRTTRERQFVKANLRGNLEFLPARGARGEMALQNCTAPFEIPGDHK